MAFSDYLDTSNTKSSTRLFSAIIIFVVVFLSLLTGYMALHMVLWPIILNGVVIPPATTILDTMILLNLSLLGTALGTKVWTKKYETTNQIDTIDIAENKKEDK